MKLSEDLSEQTSDSPAFLISTCLLKYAVNCEQFFSYFDVHYPASGYALMALARFYCTVHLTSLSIIQNIERRL
jgi:hypothetical protein